MTSSVAALSSSTHISNAQIVIGLKFVRSGPGVNISDIRNITPLFLDSAETKDFKIEGSPGLEKMANVTLEFDICWMASFYSSAVPGS